ncbi:outer membrane receptor protein involved in Fe transport [Winogradskyella epiphytica]|uniref:Outer membrane receptor protein involved in Fe transport n=1 Tax=Winogradskyella epiphytica TaxID=262005 RepID=A0A2V4XX08_9FLAO|nr:outer membrane beta-barrel family protein [Winogradskyella epiphytica]PYE83337.1 outer membrane receptor protein involved in Fe transport [Winogradskyella epiphytica]GGW57449.1 TonB-dependent receptor [Winogradskyella epiphytica]
MFLYLRQFFSVVISLLSLTLFAQDYSISGRVVDNNNAPIEFANVIISLEKEGSTLKGTSTNEDGVFNLTNLDEGTFNIKISFIGFEEFNQKIVLTGNLDLKNIQLNDASESLDEVMIIGKKPTLTRQPDRLIFNIENTALTEGSTLSVLKSTPGVIISDGSINIKSAEADVYINGRRVQLSSDELMQLLESSPANSIKSVEVITNPPASYDADSGSVINIIMSKNLIAGYRGSVFSNYTQGVFPRYIAGTSHYFKNDKINLNVNYNYTQNKINRDQEENIDFFDNSNNIDQIWRSETNRNTWSQTHNLNLNFDYYIDDQNTLSLTSTGLYTPYFKYKVTNNTSIFDENLDFSSRFTANNLSRDNKYNIGSDLIFKHDFENSADLTFNAHYTTYDYDRDQNVLSNFYDVNNDFINNSEFKSLANQKTNIVIGKLDYSLPIEDSGSFETGLKYSSVSTESDITRFDIINNSEVINANNTDAFNYNENVLSAYAAFSKSWDKWNLNLGLRVENSNIEGESLSLNEINTQDYTDWFPNASISYDILDNLAIDLNYNRSITRPSYTSLNPFSFFLNESTVVVGNPNLTPTYRDYYKVGVNFLDYFTVEAYYMNYDGPIEELQRQDNQSHIIAYTPTNLNKSVDYGFDFIFNYYPSAKWGVYAVTSFYNMTEEIDFEDGFVEQSQWTNLSILSTYLSLLEDNSLNFNLSLHYVSKNLQRLQTVEGMLFSELSISKSIMNKRAVISLSAEDLFNQQYYNTKVRYSNQSTTSLLDSDSRTIKLGFRYNFGNTKLRTNQRATSAEERDRIKDLQ